MLTLISSAVGVYYFERSGNLNYEAESQSVPVLEASWEAAREAERLRGLGLELLSGSAEVQTGTVDGSISRLEAALARPSGVPSLANDAAAVQAAAHGVADSIDALRLNQGALLQTGEAVAGLRERMAAIPADSESSIEGLRLLGRVFRAGSQAELDAMWDEFTALSQRGLEVPTPRSAAGRVCTQPADSNWYFWSRGRSCRPLSRVPARSWETPRQLSWRGPGCTRQRVLAKPWRASTKDGSCWW